MSKYLALIVFYLLHLYFHFTTRHCSKNVNDGKFNHLKNLVDYIIKSRSLFVLSPEIEDRDEVEVGIWAKHKKTFYSIMVQLYTY
jgi:hypothetical protein